MGSIMHMLSNLDDRRCIKIEEFLRSINLADKYLELFTKAGLYTVDDFMELDPDDLDLLDIDEDDLAVMLNQIQKTMDDEDAKYAATFKAKNKYDVKTANTFERIEFKKILKDLNLEQYSQNFVDNGIDTVKEFMNLDEAGLHGLNVEDGDMKKILAHISEDIKKVEEKNGIKVLDAEAK